MCVWVAVWQSPRDDGRRSPRPGKTSQVSNMAPHHASDFRRPESHTRDTRERHAKGGRQLDQVNQSQMGRATSSTGRSGGGEGGERRALSARALTIALVMGALLAAQPSEGRALRSKKHRGEEIPAPAEQEGECLALGKSACLCLSCGAFVVGPGACMSHQGEGEGWASEPSQGKNKSAGAFGHHSNRPQPAAKHEGVVVRGAGRGLHVVPPWVGWAGPRRSSPLSHIVHTSTDQPLTTNQTPQQRSSAAGWGGGFHPGPRATAATATCASPRTPSSAPACWQPACTRSWAPLRRRRPSPSSRCRRDRVSPCAC
jgi:hypothetical protein